MIKEVSIRERKGKKETVKKGKGKRENSNKMNR